MVGLIDNNPMNNEQQNHQKRVAAAIPSVPSSKMHTRKQRNVQ